MWVIVMFGGACLWSMDAALLELPEVPAMATLNIDLFAFNENLV